jgi:peroxiredoxin
MEPCPEPLDVRNAVRGLRLIETMMILRFLLLAVLVAGAGCRRDDGGVARVESPKSGATADTSNLPRLGAAPDWQLTRLDGTVMRAEELRGKVVVVDFWATWCGPCIKEIPGYIEMQRAHADRGLVIVGISLDQGGPAGVQRFVERHGVNYPIVMGDAAVAEAFGGVQSIPTTFLIDRQGQIRDRKVGAMEREEYEPLVTSLL